MSLKQNKDVRVISERVTPDGRSQTVFVMGRFTVILNEFKKPKK